MFSHFDVDHKGGDLVVEDFDAASQAGDVFGQFEVFNFAWGFVGGVGSGSHGWVLSEVEHMVEDEVFESGAVFG